MDITKLEESISSSEVPITSDSCDQDASEYVVKAKNLIHSRMLIGIEDGRFFVGTFYCMDKQGNIILQDAFEYRSTGRSSTSSMEHRAVGLVLVPFPCRTSCHVDCSIEEQLYHLSLRDKE